MLVDGSCVFITIIIIFMRLAAYRVSDHRLYIGDSSDVSSSLTLKILQLAYYRNYWTDSNQILHSDRDHQNTLRGWSKQAYNKSKMRTAAILKNRKRPYLCNALTDLHNILHDDAFWASEGYGQLQFPTFENPRWRTAGILKIKNCHISSMV